MIIYFVYILANPEQYPCLVWQNNTMIDLILVLGSSNLTDIKIGGRQLASGMSIHEFPAIPMLSSSNGSVTVLMGINFNDTTQNAKFDITLTEEDGGKRRHGVSFGKSSIKIKNKLQLCRK